MHKSITVLNTMLIVGTTVQPMGISRDQLLAAQLKAQQRYHTEKTRLISLNSFGGTGEEDAQEEQSCFDKLWKCIGWSEK